MRNVVGLVGGLGNQLFQLAFARYLHANTGLESCLDISAYRTVPKYLALPSMPFSYSEVAGLRHVPHPLGKYPMLANAYRLARGPRKIVLEGSPPTPFSEVRINRAAWYYGYWHSLDMVDEVIDSFIREMPAPEPVLPETSIGIHVRRGDMLGRPAELPADYFRRAFRELCATNGLPADTPVYIYSDDQRWCRENLRFDNVRYSSNSSAAQDLIDLSSHSHLILSGSTFSWWSARLRYRAPGVVAAPFPFDPIYPSHRDLFFQSWLAVPR